MPNIAIPNFETVLNTGTPELVYLAEVYNVDESRTVIAYEIYAQNPSEPENKRIYQIEFTYVQNQKINSGYITHLRKVYEKDGYLYILYNDNGTEKQCKFRFDPSKSGFYSGFNHRDSSQVPSQYVKNDQYHTVDFTQTSSTSTNSNSSSSATSTSNSSAAEVYNMDEKRTVIAYEVYAQNPGDPESKRIYQIEVVYVQNQKINSGYVTNLRKVYEKDGYLYILYSDKGVEKQFKFRFDPGKGNFYQGFNYRDSSQVPDKYKKNDAYYTIDFTQSRTANSGRVIRQKSEIDEELAKRKALKENLRQKKKKFIRSQSGSNSDKIDAND
jgi:hypothetical protein